MIQQRGWAKKWTRREIEIAREILRTGLDAYEPVPCDRNQNERNGWTMKPDFDVSTISGVSHVINTGPRPQHQEKCSGTTRRATDIIQKVPASFRGWSRAFLQLQAHHTSYNYPQSNYLYVVITVDSSDSQQSQIKRSD
jgi:hypothetical protein